MHPLHSFPSFSCLPSCSSALSFTSLFFCLLHFFASLRFVLSSPPFCLFFSFFAYHHFSVSSLSFSALSLRVSFSSFSRLGLFFLLFILSVTIFFCFFACLRILFRVLLTRCLLRCLLQTSLLFSFLKTAAAVTLLHPLLCTFSASYLLLL